MPIVAAPRKVEPRLPLPHVFVVGAGFSKAIGETMPTLNQLGSIIATDLTARRSFGLLPKEVQAALQRGSIPGGDLEAWLSVLASPPPFVSDAEAHFNAGIFSEIADVIGDVIDACELDVLTTPKPLWLERLIRVWDVVGATVITFNYDTLIEHAAFYVSPPGDTWPNVAFKLLKVHGSTHWWRARGDIASSPQIQTLLPGWGTSDERGEPPGDERVLVPPIAAKGSYYEPNFIRREWQRARRALEGASELFIVGYRLPVNDLAMTTLISQHLNADARIELVNVDPDEPAAVLQKIGRPAFQQIHNASCVESMVDEYEHQVGLKLLPVFGATLESLADDPPLQVRLPDRSPHAITSIEDGIEGLVLVASESPFRWDDDAFAKRASDLRRALIGATEKQQRVVIRCDSVDQPALWLSVMDQPVRWVTIEA